MLPRIYQSRYKCPFPDPSRTTHEDLFECLATSFEAIADKMNQQLNSEPMEGGGPLMSTDTQTWLVRMLASVLASTGNMMTIRDEPAPTVQEQGEAIIDRIYPEIERHLLSAQPVVIVAEKVRHSLRLLVNALLVGAAVLLRRLKAGKRMTPYQTLQYTEKEEDARTAMSSEALTAIDDLIVLERKHVLDLYLHIKDPSTALPGQAASFWYPQKRPGSESGFRVALHELQRATELGPPFTVKKKDDRRTGDIVCV